MTLVDRRYSVAEGTAVKAPCRLATTANITLSGLQTIDGLTTAADDRVLVKNQTTGSENGIYTASTGNWLRTRDFDGAYDVVTGTRIYVTAGSTNAGREFTLTTTGSITIDTTSLAFSGSSLSSAAPSRVFPTYTDLRNATPASGDTAIMLGYYTAADYGGGLFYWDSTSTATHNAGTIIQPAAGGTGRWLRVYSGAVNVNWFGAKGDGTTDDTTAVAAAVLVGYTDTTEVYITDTYLTTSSIANLHNTQLRGPGSIKRGSDVWTPTLARTATNILYVATTGSATADGLSSSEPMSTAQVAIDALVNYPGVRKGTWQIKLAAGTYTDGVYIPANLTGSVNTSTDLTSAAARIVIQGPDVGGSPNVPTAIISGASSPTTNYGFLLNGNNCVQFKDIKVSGWNATTDTTYGINATDFCSVYYDNVHLTQCGVGTVGRQSRFYVSGGITSTCSSGFTYLNGCTVSHTGHSISLCTVLGINVAEGSQGHFDTGTIDDCEIGVYIVEQSHLQISGTISNNNTVGIKIAVNSSYYDAGITFTANTINLLRYSGSYEVAGMFALPTPLRIGYNDTQVTVGTGTTAETTLHADIGVIPANVFQSSNNTITVKISGALGSNQDTRTLRLKAGGTTIGTLTLAGNASGTNSSFDAEFNWSASSLTAQLMNARLRASITPYYSAVNNGSTAIDMSTAKTLSLTGQLANTADQIVVNHVETWMT